ncbi:MAG: SprB repeat-containing protein, partial [Bacteroidetes bacterium]|nr:SprB repeat-containing protein [Bacteroidota bacterium]
MKRFLLFLISILLLSNSYSFAADRYWVGGSGNWNNPIHWAEESGGQAGVSIPTINDNVYFDNNSFSKRKQDVYIREQAFCKNFNWIVTSLNPILNGDDNAKLNIAGSFIFNDKRQNNFFGDIEFSSKQKNNIISADSLNSNIIFNGEGSWLLKTDFKTSHNIILKQGSLSTNDKNIDCLEFKGSGELNRGLILGKSKVSVDTWNFKNVDNLNFEAQKSNLTFKSEIVEESLNLTELSYNKISKYSGSKSILDAICTTTNGCHDADNATITVTVTSLGTPPYTYSYYCLLGGTTIDVTTSDETHTFFDVEQCGPCSVQIQDNQNSISFYPEISNPDAISINAVDSVNPTTTLSTDGSITVTTVTGGTLDYTYSIGGAYQVSNNFVGLAQGDYPVSVKDNNDCEQAGSTIHLKGSGGVFTLDSVANKITSKGSTGSITIYTVNGKGTVQFSIDGGANWETDNDAGDGDASSGIYEYTNKDATSQYNVQVKDDDGTLVYSKNPVKFGGVITITSVDVTDVTGCYGDSNGEIQIHYSDAAGTPYFSINNGTDWQTDSVFLSLSAGSYNIKVYDDNDNVTWATNPVVVNDPAELIIDSTTHTNSTCHDDGDGSVHVYAQGGTGDLTYRLTSSPLVVEQVNNGHFTNVAAGSYTLTVTDNNGCVKKTKKTNVANPESISISSVDVSTNIVCYQDSSASITITASGGTSPFFYSIDSAKTWQVANVFDNLPAGDYDIFVRDVNNCPSSEGVYWGGSEIISENSKINISNITTSDVQCKGESEGTINITASGGTGTLHYSINNGLTYPKITGSFSDLSAGTYYVVIKDAYDCKSDIDTVVITEPEELLINTENHTDITCNDDNDGTITITASGGTGTFYFSIDDGGSWQEDNDVSDGDATIGIYKFVGLDDNGGLAYQVKVKDDNDCETSGSSIIIINPVAVTISDENYTDITCHDSNDGTITITAIGGSGIFHFSINNGGTWQDDNDAGDGDANDGIYKYTGLDDNVGLAYQLKVKDDNGCETAVGGSITITNPTLVSISSELKTDLTCHDSNDGTITITATGGTGTLQFSIDNGLNWVVDNEIGDANPIIGTCQFIGLYYNGGSAYEVKVRDNNLCGVDGSSITLVNPTAVTITDENHNDISCHDSNDGTITITATGGSGTLHFSINDGTSWQEDNDVSDGDPIVGIYQYTGLNDNGGLAY